MSNKWKKRRKKLKGLFYELASILLFRYLPWNTRRLARHIRSLAFDRLHVGCGDIILPEWLNIFYERRQEYGCLKKGETSFCLNYNLLKSWPFDDESISFVAGSHFIEHLELSDGIKFLKECYRVLKKGGIVRLSCPDLETYAKNYVANNTAFFQDEAIQRGCYFKDAETPGEIFIAKAYDSGGAHKWFYDYESLKHIAIIAGFKSVHKRGRLEGNCPDLEKLEPPEREIETLYLEAVK